MIHAILSIMGTKLNTNPFNRYWTPYSALLHPFNLSPTTMYIRIVVSGMLPGAWWEYMYDQNVNREYFLFWTSTAYWKSLTSEGGVNWFEFRILPSTFFLILKAPTTYGTFDVFSISEPHASWPMVVNENQNPGGFAYGGEINIIVPDAHLQYLGCDYAKGG